MYFRLAKTGSDYVWLAVPVARVLRESPDMAGYGDMGI